MPDLVLGSGVTGSPTRGGGVTLTQTLQGRTCLDPCEGYSRGYPTLRRTWQPCLWAPRWSLGSAAAQVVMDPQLVPASLGKADCSASTPGSPPPALELRGDSAGGLSSTDSEL